MSNNLNPADKVYMLVRRKRDSDVLSLYDVARFREFTPSDITASHPGNGLLIDGSSPEFSMAGYRRENFCGPEMNVKNVTCISFYEDQMVCKKEEYGMPILLRFEDGVHYTGIDFKRWKVVEPDEKNPAEVRAVPTIFISFKKNGTPDRVRRTHSASSFGGKPYKKPLGVAYFYLDCRRKDVIVQDLTANSIGREKSIIETLGTSVSNIQRSEKKRDGTLLKLDGNLLKRRRDEVLQKIEEIERFTKRIRGIVEIAE